MSSLTIKSRNFICISHFLNHSLKHHLFHGVKWQHFFGDTKCHSHRHLFPVFTLPVVRDRVTECICDFHLFRLFNVSRGFSCCRRCCCLFAHPLAVIVFRLTVMLQMVEKICWATLLCCHLFFGFFYKPCKLPMMAPRQT